MPFPDPAGHSSVLSWALLLALPLVAGLAYALGAARTRRRWQDALRQAREDQRAAEQLQPGWRWQTDARHGLVHWTGPGQARSTECALFDDEALAARLRTQQAFADLHLRSAQAVDGSDQWTLQAVPRWDANGAFDGFVGSAQPLAPTRPAQAAPPAPERSEADAFSFTLSHDLRAPIRVVEGFTRIVKEDYGRVLDRVGNDHLDRVLGAAARMNLMIDALLTLAQLSQQPLARQRVNLSQLAGFVVDDLQRQAADRDVVFDITPGLFTTGDPTLLRLVLENLLGNAFKYSAKVAQARISLRLATEAGKPAFVVQDNGAGFDMRSADRLFGLFQRLHSASDFAGHGVGLASVRRIVQRHGGQMWAESEPGRGASFYFTLPD